MKSQNQKITKYLLFLAVTIGIILSSSLTIAQTESYDAQEFMTGSNSLNSTQNKSNKTCIHVFLDEECMDCSQIKNYLESLEYENITLFYYDVSIESNKEIYESFKETYGINLAGYPVLFVGDNYLIGQSAIKNNVHKLIEDCKQKDCPCYAQNILGTTSLPKRDYKPETNQVLNLPFVGDVKIGGMPLFIMTALIAFIDGFNPCSLWVLTFLLGIVIYTGSRKKIFVVGLTFLLVTAAAYGAFMLGLLNVFTYVGYLFWIKLVVGLIALIFAAVNIKDYFWYKKGISFTISDKYKPSLFKKIRNIMDPSKSLLSMIVATIIMALGIVLVELPCTAGFPMIWSNMMAQNEVTGPQFAYLFALYLIIYLLIELIIFISAVISLKASKFEEKHGRILKLVGGIIMLALAITMVFFPDAMNSIEGSLYLFGIAGLASYIIIVLHRKILPRYGIKIGSEFKDKKEIKETKKNKKNKEDDANDITK